MADTSTAVNGVYGDQYAQPAELAASTPSAPSHAPSASQSTTTSTGVAKAEAQEIGWYFVEQYYTTLSKSPERIHLFYNKKSQLVTGVEAEKVLPSVGAKAISEKIKSLDIQDCKVRVLNVDSQSSFSNIVVQVIGEMSNQNQPHHKFVQTFVLAEQPNGYFVLNDIFRYLNEDEDEIIEDEPAQPEVLAEVPTEVSAEVPAVIPAEVPAEEPPTPVEPTTVVASTDDAAASEEAAEKVDEELEEVQEEEHFTSEEAANTGEAAYEFEEPPATTETEPVEATPEEEAPVEVTPQEEPTEAPATEPIPPKASTPVPDAPPAKKTWASMLGGASKSPIVPAIPSQAPAATTQPKAPRLVQPPQPAKSTSTEPTATTPTSQGNGWQMADHGKKGKSAPQAKAAEANVLAYIKNVNEKVDARTLREVLERYGELKYFDVSRPRNCAFVEFATPEGYAAAVAANPHTVNTESISVEERRPRPGAYGGGQGSFARGNGAPGRGGRGNMQQRTGSQGSLPKDAGRGFQQPQRGSKSGNVTPRGRGQAQAA